MGLVEEEDPLCPTLGADVGAIGSSGREGLELCIAEGRLRGAYAVVVLLRCTPCAVPPLLCGFSTRAVPFLPLGDEFFEELAESRRKS